MRGGGVEAGEQTQEGCKETGGMTCWPFPFSPLEKFSASCTEPNIVLV